MKSVLAISLLFSQIAFSQRTEITFGAITKEEIEMNSYDKDRNAKAVVLYDIGKSVFFDTDNGYDIRFTRHKRIKIFDKTETEYAEVSIPYYVDGYGKTEYVRSIEAFTYQTINGNLTKQRLDPSTVYEERVNERWHNKKFVFPDVQDGSILEYRYVLETPFHFNLPDWRFQDKIPTMYSEYQVSMIPFYEYVYLVQGTNKFHYQLSAEAKEERKWGNVQEFYGRNIGSGIVFKDMVHTYVLKDIPAFNDESYISSINDYIIKMDFQLATFYNPKGGVKNIISTWPELNESLLKNEKFGKYIKNSSKIAKKILSEQMDLSDMNNTQKAKHIIDYVKNSFEWNGYYGKYASQSANDFMDNKTGNPADINLFMIALLNEAGIETEPLVLSTRNHGKLRSDYPFDHFTNYVIALVNTDSPFLADGTEELLPYNKLPTRCNNEKGLIVDNEDPVRWISLDNNVLSIEKSILTLTLDTITSDVLAQVSIQNTEYEAFLSRKNFRNDSSQIKAHYEDKIGSIKRFLATGYDSQILPYSMNFKSVYETEKFGDNIVIEPLLNLPLAQNNLTKKKRTYPVDFIYPWKNEFHSTLAIPKNFRLNEVPEGFNVSNELAEIEINYIVENNVLIVKGKYEFKKSTYVANEYPRIKYYLDQIAKRFNQPIVLERITENNFKN